MPNYWHWLKQLKAKIVNFDIKPQKLIVNDLLAEADIAFKQNNYKLAERILRRVLACNKQNAAALLRLSDLMLDTGRFHHSVRLIQKLLRTDPNNLLLYKRLAHAYNQLDKYPQYIKSLKRILELAPDDMTTQHLLAAAARKFTPAAPRAYIEDLFNDYAIYFEEALLTNLQYKGHIYLIESLCRKINHTSQLGTVLDLGCGTGLLGQELIKNVAVENLIGVDLATQMLELCRQKEIYHSLHEGDMLDYLRANDLSADLILSSDALIYFGNLEPLLALVHQRLNPGGFLGFTVEKCIFGDYRLARSGRYKHSLCYLKSLYKKYQFSRIYSSTIDLRLEYGNMVQGYLVLLQK